MIRRGIPAKKIDWTDPIVNIYYPRILKLIQSFQLQQEIDKKLTDLIISQTLVDKTLEPSLEKSFEKTDTPPNSPIRSYSHPSYKSGVSTPDSWSSYSSWEVFSPSILQNLDN